MISRKQIKFFILLSIIGFTSGFIGRFILDYPYEVSIYTKCYYLNESLSNPVKFHLELTPTDDDFEEWNKSYYDDNMTVSIIEEPIGSGVIDPLVHPQGVIVALNYTEDAWKNIEIQKEGVIEVDCPMKRTTTLANEIMKRLTTIVIGGE